MKRVTAQIQGIVQGVSFRYYILKHARDFGLRGVVKNELDESVCLVAEGEEKKLKELIDLCRVGPKYAKVKSLEFEMKDCKENKYTEFSIEY